MGVVITNIISAYTSVSYVNGIQDPVAGEQQNCVCLEKLTEFIKDA